MGIAERIISERKRLALSQEEFAKRTGVSLSSQKRYEKGERDPDSTYLEAVKALGVDVGFLLFAVRVSDEMIRALRAEVVLGHIASALGISSEALSSLLDEAEEEERRARDGLPPTDNDPTRVYRRAFELTTEAISKHPGEIDPNLLAAILRGLDSAGSAAGAVSPDKRAKVTAVLYRSFKASGKVDQAMILEVVTLAAS